MIELKTKLPKNFRQDCKDKTKYTQIFAHVSKDLMVDPITGVKTMQIIAGRYGLDAYELFYKIINDFVAAHIESEGGKP